MSISANTQSTFDEGALLAADHFRLLLDAMARPGKVFEVPPQPLEIGRLNAGAVMTMLALSDHETPVWLDGDLADEDIFDFLRFHCGCPIVDEPDHALFAVLSPSFDAFMESKFSLGTPAYPDRSTTLIIQVEALRDKGAYVLSGPGIKSTQGFHVDGLSSAFWDWRAENNKNFPLGTDVILVTDDKLAALPRTTQVREIA